MLIKSNIRMEIVQFYLEGEFSYQKNKEFQSLSMSHLIQFLREIRKIIIMPLENRILHLQLGKP